jgi:hypothetical protein
VITASVVTNVNEKFLLSTEQNLRNFLNDHRTYTHVVEVDFNEYIDSFMQLKGENKKWKLAAKSGDMIVHSHKLKVIKYFYL